MQLMFNKGQSNHFMFNIQGDEGNSGLTKSKAGNSNLTIGNSG